jgi:hypothetical protein
LFVLTAHTVLSGLRAMASSSFFICSCDMATDGALQRPHTPRFPTAPHDGPTRNRPTQANFRSLKACETEGHGKISMVCVVVDHGVFLCFVSCVSVSFRPRAVFGPSR